MRNSRFFILLLGLAFLLSACDSAFFQRWHSTPTPGFTRQPTWTRIPSRTPSITPTRQPRPTRTVTPTPSITPPRRATRTPIHSGDEPQAVDTGNVADTGIGVPGTLGVSYLSLKNSFEPLGFVFAENISLFSTQPYTATLPSIPLTLELWGSPQALTEASISFKLVLDAPQRTSQATVMMVRLLNLLLPAWDEAAPWLYEGVQEGLTSSDDFYDRVTRRGSMVVTLEMDRFAASVVLTVSGSAP